MDMTPKTRSGDRYDAGPFVLFAQYALFHSNTNGKMTLCGSEVPQDRWRGRTAGSGMWTRTRESVTREDTLDPAIPYG